MEPFFTIADDRGEVYIKASFAVALVHTWSTFVPRPAILLASASDRQLRLVPGQRARAISVMFVTVGNVYCFNCSRLSWRARSSRFDPKKDRTSGNANVYSLTPSVKTDYCASQIGHELQTLRPTSTMGFSRRQGQRFQVNFLPPPNEVIIWIERSY